MLGSIRRRAISAPVGLRVRARLEVLAPRGTPARPRIQDVVDSFRAGCEAALEQRDPATLAAALDAHLAERRGFVYEGAAMGLALVDRLVPPGRRRFWDFARGPATAHHYLLLIGAGWACAVLPGMARALRAIVREEPLDGWLAYDGAGFAHAFLSGPDRWRRALPGLEGYERRAYDQGLGRCAWFLCGADRGRIPEWVGGFEPARRADLWAGVGLACAYAAGEPASRVAELTDAAGPHAADFAQGVAFACAARRRGETPSAETAAVCAQVWDRDAEAVCALTDAAREASAAEPDDRDDEDCPRYERWRACIRERHRAR